MYSTGQKKPNRECITGKLGNAKWKFRERLGEAKNHSTGQKKPNRERVTGKLGNAKWKA